MDALAFATDKLGQGIEFVLRNGRLYVWPAKAFPYLNDADRTFIKEHRDELKDLALAKVLPETTVTWAPPSAAGLLREVAASSEPTVALAPECEYCGRTPCVGPDSPAYSALHYSDPEEVKRRDAAATAVMLKMVRFGNPY